MVSAAISKHKNMIIKLIFVAAEGLVIPAIVLTNHKIVSNSRMQVDGYALLQEIISSVTIL